MLEAKMDWFNTLGQSLTWLFNGVVQSNIRSHFVKGTKTDSQKVRRLALTTSLLSRGLHLFPSAPRGCGRLPLDAG